MGRRGQGRPCGRHFRGPKRQSKSVIGSRQAPGMTGASPRTMARRGFGRTQEGCGGRRSRQKRLGGSSGLESPSCARRGIKEGEGNKARRKRGWS